MEYYKLGMMNFSDIKCHDTQIKSLLEAVRKGQLSSAYLFVGPPGIGKKLVALNFAKFLVCRARNNALGSACGVCPACKKVDNLQHPDIFLISGEAVDNEEADENKAVIKIEHIREVLKRSYLMPYEAEYKVFIIEGAENMTEDASNAILKTLEEPSRNTIFILIAKSEKMLLPTIVSRCKRFRFNAPTFKETKEILMEDYHLDEEKAHFAAYFCEGRIAEALGAAGEDILKDKNAVIDAFLKQSVNFKGRLDARRGLSIFLGWLRDLCMLKSGYAFLINSDRKEDLAVLKDKYSLKELEEKIDFISEAMMYLERNINVRLFNNLIRIKLCKT